MKSTLDPLFAELLNDFQRVSMPLVHPDLLELCPHGYGPVIDCAKCQVNMYRRLNEREAAERNERERQVMDGRAENGKAALMNGHGNSPLAKLRTSDGRTPIRRSARDSFDSRRSTAMTPSTSSAVQETE